MSHNYYFLDAKKYFMLPVMVLKFSHIYFSNVYFNISKAFDKEWHEGLIYELQRCGIAASSKFLAK